MPGVVLGCVAALPSETAGAAKTRGRADSVKLIQPLASQGAYSVFTKPCVLSLSHSQEGLRGLDACWKRR